VRLQRQQPQQVEPDQHRQTGPRRDRGHQERQHRHQRHDEHRHPQVERQGVGLDVGAQQADRARVEQQHGERDQRHEQQRGAELDRGGQVGAVADRGGQHGGAERGQRVDPDREQHQQGGVVVDAAHPGVQPAGLQPAGDHLDEADRVREVLRPQVPQLLAEPAGGRVGRRPQLDDEQRGRDRVHAVDERAQPAPRVRGVVLRAEAPAPGEPHHGGEASSQPTSGKASFQTGS